ncbi:hypothetical protein JTE90_024096 [Oedothorax gibbosus]|uniref:Uncharacterized protein n=1 Tax=Oedothorax gibbosus TaxID=931172 RepID=A0AAV6URH4_9ARAC|nr:hypothetical protein JTE90_024096 [Oedothorax gibbosus]
MHRNSGLKLTDRAPSCLTRDCGPRSPRTRSGTPRLAASQNSSLRAVSSTTVASELVRHKKEEQATGYFLSSKDPLKNSLAHGHYTS